MSSVLSAQQREQLHAKFDQVLDGLSARLTDEEEVVGSQVRRQRVERGLRVDGVAVDLEHPPLVLRNDLRRRGSGGRHEELAAGHRPEDHGSECNPRISS